MPLLEVALPADETAPSSRSELSSRSEFPSRSDGEEPPARPEEVLAALDGLVGEAVFPVVTGDGVKQPTLIALDASGVPLVVEMVGHLDHIALLRALGHAGAAGRMSRGQLAAQYQGGLGGFARDLSQFLDAVPFRRAATGNRGARLIVICADADQTVLNAVDFLNRPELPIKVLRAGALQATDGQRFIDVSPLVVNPSSPPEHPELVGQTAVSRLRISAVDAEGYRRAAVASTAGGWGAGGSVSGGAGSGRADSGGGHVPRETLGGEAPSVLLGSRKARRLALVAGAAAGGIGQVSAPVRVATAGDSGTGPRSEPIRVATVGPEPDAGFDGHRLESLRTILSRHVLPDGAAAPALSRRERRLAAAQQLDDGPHSAAPLPAGPRLSLDMPATPLASGAGLTPMAQPLSVPAPPSVPYLAPESHQTPDPHRAPASVGVVSPHLSPVEAAIERAKHALAASAHIVGPGTVPGPPASRSWARTAAEAPGIIPTRQVPSRTSVRAARHRRPDSQPIEFTGVFAKGTDAADPLSWDTTQLPVIARPITTSVPLVVPNAPTLPRTSEYPATPNNG
ncbi:MAG: hypothetical protein LBB58_03200 [Cellulomonadaceae bacterium]|nr:hypothetical protein [Cellulomonadaceae bacterium]